MYSETTALAIRGSLPLRDRDCGRRYGPVCLPDHLWRIPQTHRSTDRHRMSRCPAARIQSPPENAFHYFQRGHDTETLAADTCTDTSCRSVSECCRDRSNTPSHLPRGYPHCWSARKGALSGLDPVHSTRRRRSTVAACHRRCRPGRLRPSDRLATARWHGSRSPPPFHL